MDYVKPHMSATTTFTVKMWCVGEAQWRDEQQAPQTKHQNKVMTTLDGTKMAHTTC